MIKKIFCSIMLCAGFGLASAAYGANYTIDADHSSVTFKIKHLAISTVKGGFTGFSGTFSFDPKNVKASKAEASIAVKSINTDVKKRDDHLRGADFFDETKFPQMTFKTTSIEPVSDTEFKAIGELTMHGVTKPVELMVTYGGEATDPWGNTRAAFSATAKLNRKDFGLTWNKALETGGLVVGEDVTIAIEVEGIKQKAA